MLVLYHSGLTTCSKQVRHCLREKGLAYESRYVNLLRFEHLSPDYLKLNPNGVVPTLVHDGHVITNSACINEYIDETFPRPRLSPADPKDRARMRYWTWTADDAHLQGARLTRNQRLKASVEQMSAADIGLVLERMPAPARRERWQRQAVGGHSQDEMETALAHMRFVADQMDQELAARGPWLAGETFSLADISIASLIHRTRELFPELLPAASHPHLDDWYTRLMVRPAAALTYAAGTAETPKIPPQRSVAGIAEYRIPAPP
jgi:glutathione S-transferase